MTNRQCAKCRAGQAADGNETPVPHQSADGIQWLVPQIFSHLCEVCTMVKFRERYKLLCERRRNKVFQIVSDNPQVVTVDWAQLYKVKDITISKQIGGSRKDRSLIPSMVSADHLITTRWFLTAAGIFSPDGVYLVSDEAGHIFTPFYHGESDRLLFVAKQEAKNWAQFYLRAFSGSGLRIIGDSEVVLVEF